VIEGLHPRIQEWPGLGEDALILALDYDGTLVPICQRPDDAQPDPDLLSLLQDLALNATVILLTGRDRKDMERWITAHAITVVAFHGAEWRHNGLWKPLILAQKARQPLKTLAERLEEAFRDTSGVIVENKGFTIAFHYRLVKLTSQPDLLRRLDGLIHQWKAQNEGFEVLEGKCLKEIRPRGLDKGTALLKAMEKLGVSSAPVLAMGDDRTDEDMFRSLRDQDISILVGSQDTSAKVRLRDVWEAREVLKGILRIKQKSGLRSQQ
jgi:trehalose 6-phosphate synthase/phosphatase